MRFAKRQKKRRAFFARRLNRVLFLFDFDNFAVAVSRVNFDFDFKVVGFEFDDPAVIAVFYVAAAVIEFSVHIVDDKIVFARHS